MKKLAHALLLIISIKKLALALLLIISIISSFNISATAKTDEIIFTIDGNRTEKVNLTIFLVKNNVQIRTVSEKNVPLPFNFFVPFNETGEYRINVVNQKGESANSSINVTVKANTQIRDIVEKESQGAELAITIGIIGLIVLVLLWISFIKNKNYSK